MSEPTKHEVRDILEKLEDLDLPDGAYWSLVHYRLGLEYGDVFEIIAEDPDFFSYSEDGP